MGGGDRVGRRRPSGRVLADPVAEPRDDPGLVLRHPEPDPVAEPGGDDLDVLAERLDRAALDPASLVLEAGGEVPVVERHDRRDVIAEQLVDDAVVEVEARRVHAAAALGQHARPGDREAERGRPEVTDEADVLDVAMVEVARDRAVVAVAHLARRAAEAVPDALAAPVELARPLDLVRRGADTPEEGGGRAVARGEWVGRHHLNRIRKSAPPCPPKGRYREVGSATVDQPVQCIHSPCASESATRWRRDGPRESRAEDDDQGHRRARRRLQGRRLLRAQRPARRLRRDPRQDPRHRQGAGLVSEPRRPCPLGLTGRRLRPRARPPGGDDRARAVLHGVDRRARGEALAPRDRPDAPDSSAPSTRRSSSTERWFGEQRVDGVFVVDVRHDDPAGRGAARDGPAGGRDRRAARRRPDPLRLARRGIGRRRGRAIPRRARPPAGSRASRASRSSSTPSSGRGRSSDSTAALGLEAEVVATDYTPESGARATRRLLSLPDPPTAIIFDSDLLAVTGLGVAQQMGFVVPDDLSLIGWDDSLISRVVHPPLTAITRDIEGYGETAARPPARRDRRCHGRGRRGAARRADPARQHRAAAEPRRTTRIAAAARNTPAGRPFARCSGRSSAITERRSSGSAGAFGKCT